jgi:molybdate transport system permease protein
VSFAPLVLSFEVAAIAVLLAAVVGVAIAALLAKSESAVADLLDGVVIAPMVLPPTVLGYYVLVLLGRDSTLGRLFERVTGSPLVFSPAAAVVAATLGALPLVVLSARAAIESVDPTLVRSARTLGAGPVRTLMSVELPLAFPGIAAGIVLGFARALGDFGVTLMVAGDIPGHTQTASLAIYDAITANREASALPMIVVLTVAAVTAVIAAGVLTRRLRAH